MPMNVRRRGRRQFRRWVRQMERLALWALAIAVFVAVGWVFYAFLR
jgi:hypothetical protein